MIFESILFYIFGSVCIFSSFMVIQSNNPVHSVLFLILAFFNAAGLLLLLEVDFMALIFIMIYVGAIAVLFLFVVMMLNIKRAKTSDKSKYLSFGSILFLIFTIQIYLMVQNNYIQLVDSSTNNTEIIQWFTKIDTVSNINTIGQILYTSYFIYFLIAGIILLIGMISSITLSMQDLSGVRRQHVFQQISRNLETAIFITSRKKDYNLDINK